jgi:hypothetical protein
MRVVAIEELRRNLASFLELSLQGEEFLAARKGRVKALVRPVAADDGYPPISTAAFRDRAGRVIREAARQPRLITWYGIPAAAVVSPPERWAEDEQDEMEEGLDA